MTTLLDQTTMLGGAAPSVAVGSRVFMTAQAMSDEGLQGTDLGEALLANWTCSCGCNSAEMLLAFCINQVKKHPQDSLAKTRPDKQWMAGWLVRCKKQAKANSSTGIYRMLRKVALWRQHAMRSKLSSLYQHWVLNHSLLLVTWTATYMIFCKLRIRVVTPSRSNITAC